MKVKSIIILLFISKLCFCQSDYSIAENYFRQSEYKKAIQYYEKLIQRNPFNSFYLKRLITCHQEENEFDTAEGYIKDALEINKAQTYWYVELGYNFQRQQKDSLAQIEYSRAIDAIRKKPSVGGLTGRFFRDNNLLKEAVMAYELTMLLNKNANYEFQLARIYGEQGEIDKMFSAYVNLIDKNENYLGSVQRYASSYITEDSKSKYNQSFKRALLKKSVSNPKRVWNELLSWLFTKQGEYQKAFIQEKAVFQRQPDDIGNLVVLGKIAFNDAAYQDVKNIFSFVLKNALSIDTRLNAELFILKTEVKINPKNAFVLFNTVLDNYGYSLNTIQIQKEYANYLTFELGQPQKAKEVLEKALSLTNSKFEKARIKLQLGEVLVFIGQFNKALIYFSQVQTQLKNHPLAQEARFKVAETSFFKNDFPWAKAQLKVLKGSTSQLIANDAVQLFLIISDNEPKDSIPTGLKDFAKGKLLAYQNKKNEAIRVLSNLLTNYQGQNIEDETLLELANLQVDQAQFQAAVSNLQKIITIDKSGVFVDDAYYLLAEIYRKHLNDTEKASEYYQKIIFEQASSIYLVDARKKFRKLRGDAIN